MNAEVKANDGVLDSGGPSDVEEYTSSAEEQDYYKQMDAYDVVEVSECKAERARNRSAVGGNTSTKATTLPSR